MQIFVDIDELGNVTNPDEAGPQVCGPMHTKNDQEILRGERQNLLTVQVNRLEAFP
jgi:hypothetical protein